MILRINNSKNQDDNNLKCLERFATRLKLTFFVEDGKFGIKEATKYDKSLQFNISNITPEIFKEFIQICRDHCEDDEEAYIPTVDIYVVLNCPICGERKYTEKQLEMNSAQVDGGYYIACMYCGEIFKIEGLRNNVKKHYR